MNNLALKDGEHEILLTSDYDSMMERLTSAQKAANFANYAVQLYASWIVYNSLWAEAANAFWSDMETGEVYADSLHASDEIRKRLRFRRDRLFHTQSEFFEHLENTIHNFKISTFWSRHRTIVNRVELWRRAHSNPVNMPEDVFVDIVKDVVLYGKRIDDVIIMGVFDVVPGKRGTAPAITSVSESIDIDKLGIEIEGFGELDDEEAIRDVAIVALDKINEAHDQVRAGETVTSVVKEIKNDVLDEPTINFWIKNKLGTHICLDYTPAGGEYLMPTKTYQFVILNGEGDPVDLMELEGDVIDYLERKLRITIHGWQ